MPADKVWYVEAVKGLESNAVGKDALRVRTLVQFRSGSWTSLTGGPPVIISRATTALAAIMSLRRSTSPVDPAGLMGSLEVAGQSTAFRDTGTGVGKTEWSTVLDLVTTALLADHDPLEGLLFGGGSYDLKPGISADTRPFIKAVKPALAAVGEEIRIEGSGFGTEPASVSVRFAPGVAAAVTSTSPTELRAIVPPAAPGGERGGDRPGDRGRAAEFRRIQRPGAGHGLRLQPGAARQHGDRGRGPPQVLFATPTTIVLVVPTGAAAGSAPIKVKTGRGEAQLSAFTVVGATTALGLDAFTPSRGYAGQTVTLRGNFGDATGSVIAGDGKVEVAAWR